MGGGVFVVGDEEETGLVWSGVKLVVVVVVVVVALSEWL